MPRVIGSTSAIENEATDSINLEQEEILGRWLLELKERGFFVDKEELVDSVN